MLLSYNSLEQHMNGWISSSICTFSHGSWASIDDEVNHLPRITNFWDWHCYTPSGPDINIDMFMPMYCMYCCMYHPGVTRRGSKIFREYDTPNRWKVSEICFISLLWASWYPRNHKMQTSSIDAQEPKPKMYFEVEIQPLTCCAREL